MSVTLNIGRTETITYRTDCFSSYSSVKNHYIRNHNVNYYRQGGPYGAYVDGYQDEIRDVPGNDSNTYDIGDNPSSWFPTNPIICDKLLLFASFKNVTLQNPGPEFDCCYTKLKFYQPALTFNDLYSWSGHPLGYMIHDYSQYGMNTLDFAWLTELYFDKKTLSSNWDYVLKASGQYYHEGSGFTTISDEIIGDTTSIYSHEIDAPEKKGRVCTCVDFTYQHNHNDTKIGRYGYYGLKDCICTKDELLSRFTYDTPTKPEAYKAIEDNFPYGALILCGDSTQLGLMGQGWREGWQGVTDYSGLVTIGNINIENKPYTRLCYTTLIPFISQAEYNAAKASIYTWDSIPVIE